MPEQLIPQFGLAHRLQLALEVSQTSVDAMAAALGVHNNTVHNYMRTTGGTTPKRGALRVWAQVTGVPLQWLETGELDLTADECAPWESNPEPAECFLDLSTQQSASPFEALAVAA